MIVSGLHALYIKQQRMTVLFLSVASLLFQYCFTRRLRLFDFQQSFALHFVIYIEEKAKNIIVFGCACAGVVLFLSGITVAKRS
jgi:hypothetical protein